MAAAMQGLGRLKGFDRLNLVWLGFVGVMRRIRGWPGPLMLVFGQMRGLPILVMVPANSARQRVALRRAPWLERTVPLSGPVALALMRPQATLWA